MIFPLYVIWQILNIAPIYVSIIYLFYFMRFNIERYTKPSIKKLYGNPRSVPCTPSSRLSHCRTRDLPGSSNCPIDRAPRTQSISKPFTAQSNTHQPASNNTARLHLHLTSVSSRQQEFPPWETWPWRTRQTTSRLFLSQVPWMPWGIWTPWREQELMETMNMPPWNGYRDT